MRWLGLSILLAVTGAGACAGVSPPATVTPSPAPPAVTPHRLPTDLPAGSSSAAPTQTSIVPLQTVTYRDSAGTEVIFDSNGNRRWVTNAEGTLVPYASPTARPPHVDPPPPAPPPRSPSSRPPPVAVPATHPPS